MDFAENVYMLCPVLMSIVLFFAMGIDKRRAKKGRRRISEKCLFTLAVFGGAIGGTLGMYLFHHKTRHWYFRYCFPLLAAIQTVILFFMEKFP